MYAFLLLFVLSNNQNDQTHDKKLSNIVTHALTSTNYLTSKKIKELVPGQVLEVASDDEGIKKDMPAWCETTSHEWVGLEEENGADKKILQSLRQKNQCLSRPR